MTFNIYFYRSEIRDHQYNNSRASSSMKQQNNGNADSTTGSENFIKQRYKRERQFIKYLNSLFLKVSFSFL